MKRFLKRHLRRFVPARLQEWIKRRVAARISGDVQTRVDLFDDTSSVRCVIDGAWSFDAPPECRPALVSFATSHQGKEEFCGMAEFARRGGVLFDIGAHQGLVSAMFCAAHRGNRAFAFEPSPILAAGLETIRRLNGLEERMSIGPVAVGEAAGLMTMLIDPAGGYVQTQRFRHSMWAEPLPIEVRVESIPGSSARLGVVPDFIKLDVEGFEYEVVMGAAAFLARHRPVLFFELHLNYLEQRNLSARTVVDLLSQCGYSFYAYGGKAVSPRQLYDSLLQIVHFVARG